MTAQKKTTDRIRFARGYSSCVVIWVTVIVGLITVAVSCIGTDLSGAFRVVLADIEIHYPLKATAQRQSPQFPGKPKLVIDRVGLLTTPLSEKTLTRTNLSQDY